MFPSAEIIEYTELLHALNENNSRTNYTLIRKGGGTDGIPHYKLLKNLTTRVYVIWVRGTRFTDPNDAKINIQISEKVFYNGKCHRGYFLAAIGVIDQIRGFLDDNEINKIVCLGHSLGGAVASLIAIMIQRGDDASGTIRGMSYFRDILIQDGIKAIVFGTPPVVSDTLCEYSRSFITNIVNDKDFIPKLGNSFDALRNLHIKYVSILMYNLIEPYHHVNISNNDKLDPNRLVGKVIIIDPRSKTIFQGTNLKKILHYSDVLGLFHHQMIHYYNIILSITPDNYTQRLDRGIILVSEKSTIKKTTMIVVGTVATGVAAYLAIGFSVAVGVLGAIASSSH